MSRTPANRRHTAEEEEAFGLQTMTAPVPATKKVPEKVPAAFTLRMAPGIYTRVAELAKAEDRSMQWVLNKIVTAGLEQWGKKGGTK